MFGMMEGEREQRKDRWEEQNGIFEEENII